jgi:hypothetical protein
MQSIVLHQDILTCGETHMRQLLYISDTERDFSQDALDDILAISRQKNRAADVTGVLLYLDGAFLQVLEGSDEAVGAIYASVVKDPRHRNVRTLLDRDAPRAFGEWSMGFERLRPGQAETAELFQISDDAIAGRLKPDAAHELVTLLKTFYRIQCGRGAPSL